MLDDQMIEQNVLPAPLGQNAYQTSESVNDNSLINQDEGYFGKPDKYDYSQVQLPENYCYDQNLLNEFNDLAGRYNLSQKGANELMSLAVKLTQLMSNNYSAAKAEQNRQKIDNYQQLLTSDRELGGNNLGKTIATANIAYSEFADNDVQQLLAESGLNCHPQIIRMFYNIGKKMQNDSVYPMNQAILPKESREDILFPTMA